jgi:Flp pilus assembly protein TadD
MQNHAEKATLEYEFALKNASALQPNNIDIYKTLGLIYLKQKKFQAAKDTYKMILNIEPKDAQSHFYLGNIYDQSLDRPAAIKELYKSLELKPDYPEALNYLGYLFVETNRDLDKAEVMIKKALEIEPDNGAYVDSLGWLYFKQDKLEKAVKELERASVLLEDPVIYDHLGDVYQKAGDKAKARVNWDKSLKLDSDQAQVKKKIEELDKISTDTQN